MTEGLSTVGLGAIIGAALCYMLEERPPGALVIAGRGARRCASPRARFVRPSARRS